MNNDNKKPEKLNPKARHKARRYALQALYQWQISSNDLRDIEQQYLRDNDMKKVDVTFFSELLHQIPAQLDVIDAHFSTYLDRPIKELDPVELALLRIGAYELSQRLDIPYRVVINEALELAKTFGAEESYKYINGVLDQVARQLRVTEMRSTEKK